VEVKIFQIDAFAETVFEGNPAAVCPLDKWLPDDVLQRIAQENNLSETAFFIKEGNSYHIRWFTPVFEVDLCGHATIATAFVIFEILKNEIQKITFNSRSGELIVTKKGEYIELNFPVAEIIQCETPPQISQAFGKEPIEVWCSDDYMVVFENESDIKSLSPNFTILNELECRGVIATSKGSEVDFVSRFFAPRCGVNEDPVTGSAHCKLIPYWAQRLGKNSLTALQLSQRGGKLLCELINDHVLIAGKAVKYLEGTIEI